MLFKCPKCKFESVNAGACPRCGYWMLMVKRKEVFVIQGTETNTSPWTKIVEVIE